MDIKLYEFSVSEMYPETKNNLTALQLTSNDLLIKQRVVLSNVGKDKTGQLGLDFFPVTGEHRKSINNFLSLSHLGHKIIIII